MIDELLLEAHTAELRRRGREFEQRMAWAQADRVERLERALRKARAGLRFGAAGPKAVAAD